MCNEAETKKRYPSLTLVCLQVSAAGLPRQTPECGSLWGQQQTTKRQAGPNWAWQVSSISPHPTRSHLVPQLRCCCSRVASIPLQPPKPLFFNPFVMC